MSDVSEEYCKIMSQELYDLQATKNKGLGISCVRQLCDYLYMGDVGKAKTIVQTECDKMREYQEIWQYLLDHGLREKEWSEKQ
jgi:hypothetical protein